MGRGDDLYQGAGDKEEQPDDPGFRKKLGGWQGVTLVLACFFPHQPLCARFCESLRPHARHTLWHNGWCVFVDKEYAEIQHSIRPARWCGGALWLHSCLPVSSSLPPPPPPTHFCRPSGLKKDEEVAAVSQTSQAPPILHHGSP